MKNPLIVLVFGAGILLSIASCDAFVRSLEPSASYPAGSEQRIIGIVVNFIDECVVDGYCYYVVETDAGHVNVVVHPGSLINECANKSLLDRFDVDIGETVTAFGKINGGNDLHLCDDPAYTIEPVSR